jgi:hypothetical protein
VQDKSTWEKRYNRELYKLFNEPDIIEYIKIIRLSWDGYIIRTENSRIVKTSFDTRPEGAREIERSKLSWEDDVIQDIRALEAQNWMNVAMDRKDWLKPLKKARVHIGLPSR